MPAQSRGFCCSYKEFLGKKAHDYWQSGGKFAQKIKQEEMMGQSGFLKNND